MPTWDTVTATRTISTSPSPPRSAGPRQESRRNWKPLSAIRSYGDKSGLSYARPEDRQEILDFYRAYAARTHGATVHHYMDPHRIFDMPYVVVCRRDGRLTGYFTFDFVAVDHYTDMYHDLLVPEIWTRCGSS